MLTEYIKALLLIFIAEMGDKTQILAMIFSTRYPVKKVLLGVAMGSFLNHGVAVLFGKYIGSLIPTYILQMVAGVAFLGFALWTALDTEDEAEEEVEKKLTKSAVITVATAFFIGELGDKTQLTAITLSVDSVYPIWILLGTVSGMVLTSGVGIFVGSKVGHKIPDVLLKIIAAVTFLVFGVTKLVASIPENWVNIPLVLFMALVVLVILGLILRNILNYKKRIKLTNYQKAADRVYHYFQDLSIEVAHLCKGTNHCGQCQGTQCGIGYLKHMVTLYTQKGIINNHDALKSEIVLIKNKFDTTKLTHLLSNTLHALDHESNENLHYVREVLELLLLDEPFNWPGSVDAYLNLIKKHNRILGKTLAKNYYKDQS